MHNENELSNLVPDFEQVTWNHHCLLLTQLLPCLDVSNKSSPENYSLTDTLVNQIVLQVKRCLD